LVAMHVIAVVAEPERPSVTRVGANSLHLDSSGNGLCSRDDYRLGQSPWVREFVDDESPVRRTDDFLFDGGDWHQYLASRVS